MKSPAVFSVCANILIILFTTALGLMKTGNPSRYFGEGRFTTGISCFELLLTTFFALQLFAVRRASSVERGTRAGYWVWLLIAAGFVFLAADDAFQFHERMDKWIMKVFHIPPSNLADRIDDAIIGLYGLLGLGVLGYYRDELRQFRLMLWPLGAGFACLFASVICDTLANQPDVFMWLTRGNEALSRKLDGWFSVGDGAFMLLAEGLFAAAFFLAWRTAKGVPVQDARGESQVLPE